MYALRNTKTGALANSRCNGQHDVWPVWFVDQAKTFDTFGEASDFSQNFDDTWTVQEY